MLLHPSPAIVVRADTSIDECLKTMRKHNVGSLLIVNNELYWKLVGIFTERDLLTKFDFKQAPKYAGAAIHSLMSKKITTLNINELDRAPQILLEHGFRHLPIVATDPEYGDRLVGVISMRDLFRTLAEEHIKRAGNQTTLANVKPRVMGIHTTDLSFETLLKKILPVTTPYRWVPIFQNETIDKTTDKTTESEILDLVIMDLDGLKPSLWTDWLKEFLGRRSSTPLLLTYSPNAHSAKILEVLKKLQSSRAQMAVFAKPVNIIALSTFLRQNEQA